MSSKTCSSASSGCGAACGPHRYGKAGAARPAKSVQCRELAWRGGARAWIGEAGADGQDAERLSRLRQRRGWARQASPGDTRRFVSVPAWRGVAGGARHGRARLGKERIGWAGEARRARTGLVWHVVDRPGTSWQARAVVDSLGLSSPGSARHGEAGAVCEAGADRRGQAGQVRLGTVRPGKAGTVGIGRAGRCLVVSSDGPASRGWATERQD
jgi:hypothetical protein